MYRATRPLPAYTLQRRQLYANLSAQLGTQGLATGVPCCPILLVYWPAGQPVSSPSAWSGHTMSAEACLALSRALRRHNAAVCAQGRTA